jgi:hypothetical protein
MLDFAYQLHPERFVRQPSKQPAVPTEVWIDKPLNLEVKVSKFRDQCLKVVERAEIREPQRYQ